MKRVAKIELCCDGQVATFKFGDADDIETELERLKERERTLREQGDEGGADATHVLWLHIKIHCTCEITNAPTGRAYDLGQDAGGACTTGLVQAPPCCAWSKLTLGK